MPSPLAALEDLLATLFTEPELRRFVSRLPDGEALARSLPGAGVTLAREVAGLARAVSVGSRRQIPALGMEFVWVPAGSFQIGATTKPGQPGFDPDADDDESPAHRVTISAGFWRGRFPVTNAQYRRFVGLPDQRRVRGNHFWGDCIP